MRCDKCESAGLKLHKYISSQDQLSLSKEMNALIALCEKNREYFILECETHHFLVPADESPRTRYQCSKRHSWFI